MDVDGTMADGGVTLLSQTEEIAIEIKTFDAQRSAKVSRSRTRLVFARAASTGRQSSALLRREREAREMWEFIYMKQALKTRPYEEIVRK